MANINNERADAAEALYNTWAYSDMYQRKYENAASVIAVLFAYLNDRYDLGIESIPGVTEEATDWLQGVDGGADEA